MEKTTGPSAMARLDNPVAHPSGAEGGALRVLCAEYLCGYLTEGGEDGVLVRRVSRLAARYTARVAETATEWAVNM
jgi:hypothetical protein